MCNQLKRIFCERVIAWLVFLLFIRFLLDRLMASYSIVKGESVVDYYSFDISDWLINYEGGFIRRGIIGQILWEIEQLYLYDVRIVITIICLATSIILLLLIIRIFMEEGWSLLIIPTGFIFGFTLFNLGGRRDMLSLLLTFVIFILFKNIFLHRQKQLVWLLLFYFVSVLQIFIHEASFFYTFPILFLLYFYNLRKNHLSVGKKSLICVLYFMPVIIAMFIVCVFKGNPMTADIIWTSWTEVFESFPCYGDSSVIGEGVDALAWGAQDTFLNHLKAGYLGSHSPSFLRIPLVFLNLFAAYLLVTRINTVDMGLYKKKQMDNVLMSNIVLIQLFAMLPMFTILSCDWGRTIPYWLFSSLFFYHIFKEFQMVHIPFFSRASHVIQNVISNNPILRNSYTYILLVLLCPIPGACAPFDFSNTIQQGVINTFLCNIVHF